jgi:hypothetical protein
VDGFAIFIVCLVAAIVVALVAIGKWYPGSGMDVLRERRGRSLEDEVQLEHDDVQQMLDAQNDRRRRTGRPDRSEHDVRSEVAAEQDAQRRLG